MRSKERRDRLLDALQQLGRIDVEALADQFAVSASTIRRDLQVLSNAKAVTRTYGGAVLAYAAPEESLSRRQMINGPEKKAIAKAAAHLLEDEDVVILDAGSTITALGQHLRGRKHQVITNNLALMPILKHQMEIELIVLGGRVRETSMSTIGPLAMEGMRRMTADKVFLGADGVVAGRGLCEASLEQVALKSLMIEQAREVIVLADATKLGRAVQTAWASLPRRWTLITDSRATTEQCKALEEAGATIIRAHPDAGPV